MALTGEMEKHRAGGPASAGGERSQEKASAAKDKTALAIGRATRPASRNKRAGLRHKAAGPRALATRQHPNRYDESAAVTPHPCATTEIPSVVVSLRVFLGFRAMTLPDPWSLRLR